MFLQKAKPSKGSINKTNQLQGNKNNECEKNQKEKKQDSRGKRKAACPKARTVHLPDSVQKQKSSAVDVKEKPEQKIGKEKKCSMQNKNSKEAKKTGSKFKEALEATIPPGGCL